MSRYGARCQCGVQRQLLREVFVFEQAPLADVYTKPGARTAQHFRNGVARAARDLCCRKAVGDRRGLHAHLNTVH